MFWNILLIAIFIYATYVVYKGIKITNKVAKFGYPLFTKCPNTIDELLERMETPKIIEDKD